MSLQVPKPRSLPFETTIIECYRRHETSVEEALIEMYLDGAGSKTSHRRFGARMSWRRRRR